MRRNNPFLAILILLISLPIDSFSQSTPLVFRGQNGECTSSSEICGDGIDQDCDGKDILCSGSDKDRDGFTTNDCDDTNRGIYPGINTSCNVNGKLGTQTCQQNGIYTACSEAPLCEASGAGRCYYVSKLTGSDTNNGSFKAPFRSLLPLVSYYSNPPPNSTTLKAGDVVYLMSGLYDETYSYNSESRQFFLRGVKGTLQDPITIKAYPGAKVLLKNTGHYNSPIVVWNSANLIFEGIEVAGNYGTGVIIEESDSIEIRNMWIHDNDGVDNDNIAGISVRHVNGIRIHHNMIHDNYDHTNADTGGNKTENSRNIVLFGGGNARVDHNIIFQTPPTSAQKGGGCVVYKHGATLVGSTFEVDHNMMWNCSFHSIGSGTFGTRIHNNLIIDSGAPSIRDFGGPTFNQDIIIEKNTLIRTEGLDYAPTEDYRPIGQTTYRNNIVYETVPLYNNNRAILSVLPYGSDSLYNTIMDNHLIKLNDNCYYNPNTIVKFSLFSSPTFGALGGLYDLNEWRALGFDSNSSVVDPGITSDFQANSPDCAGKGWLAN